MKARTRLFGMGEVSVDKDLNLHLHNTGKVLSKVEMQEMCDIYKGANRIYKPMGLLFWTDVKNGESKNWELI